MRVRSTWFRIKRRFRRKRFDPEELRRRGYFSQDGQDRYVVEHLLPGLRNGVFVDVGAYDGLTFSNTAYLEKNLGWTGIAVEPMPDAYERLRSNRSCVCVNAAIADSSGTRTMLVLDGDDVLSGLVDQLDPRHLARIERELEEVESARRGRAEVEVQCYSLNDLLEAHGMKHIDYLKIDVEGAEWAILSTFDLSRFPTAVIGVENNYWDPRFQELLTSRGYALDAVVGGDEMYVRRDLVATAGSAPVSNARSARIHG